MVILNKIQRVALTTIVIKEVSRFTRIWVQTLLPPSISIALYFIIFGNLIGPRIGQINGINYIDYITPGLIMMAIINNSYANVVSSFFGAKFQRHIEEMLVAPISNFIILSGYVIGGTVRGVMIGIVITFIATFFTNIQINHIFITIIVAILTATAFSLGGLINGIFAKKFDDISIIPAFILMPLIYLGGVFYSIDLLPSIWQSISTLNPILYMVNAFRYGMIGSSDIDIKIAFIILLVSNAILFAIALFLLEKGIGIKE